MSEPAPMDQSTWITHSDIVSAMGVCAPELKTLVRLSHKNPLLKYATIESRRGATKYFNRKLFVTWLERRFKDSPQFVERVRERLLSPPPKTPSVGGKR